MEFAIKLFALLIGAQLLKDPIPCDCHKEQNMLVANESNVHLIDFNKNRCKLDLLIDINIDLEDDVFGQFIISVYSSDHGLLDKQMVDGASSIHMREKLMLKKGEKIWIKMTSDDKKSHLVRIISSNYL